MGNIELIDKIGFLSATLALPFHYWIQYHFLNKFLGFKGKIYKFVFFVVLLIIFNFLTLKIQYPFRIIVNDLLWFILLCYLCYGNILIKLYAAIVPDAILLLIYITFLSFDFHISSYINSLNIGSGRDLFLLCLINLGRELINLALFFMVLKNICKFLNFKDRTVNTYQSLYLLIPCLATYSLILIFYFVQAIHVDNKDYYLFSIFPGIYSAVPLVSISLLVSILITAYTFKKMLEGEEIQQKNLLMEQQFKFQIDHSKNLEGVYSGIRRIMHDMNNHLICLKNLAKSKNIEEINNYLDTLGQTINKLDCKIKTGNAVSDAVINEKYNIAKLEDIEFSCDFLIPEGLTLSSVDLCIILGNALDNALEACMRIKNGNIHKEISVNSYIRDLYLIIEVSNSATDKIQYNKNKIVTKKNDKINHGIGISNIEMIVEKYNGILDIIEGKNKFVLNLMLKVKET
ncbi:sensor histidine kinase [Clostridium sporogenes]|uniref:sensor histidine kinase n=1 Tax=Clostridium sporogenes TaxID=1509 RepID=UPI002237890A|nr:sensor histidine kinase [Clostridium sporogenes]EKS4344355.1 GHKL domain-containing protein [Clostridium botulinum]EKS4394233.1 GHKL domain-containing protein [Clostridium botulinum]MCW6079430.1 GHKL domain-containing protein [Clostridium sporogenes]